MKNKIKGLVLAGGFSRRMGRDKALLNYHGIPQARWTGRLLEEFCEEVYFSCREGQDLGDGDNLENLRIHDPVEGQGPMGGMLAAHRLFPDCTWLVVACDLPMLDDLTLNRLLELRDPGKLATAYRSHHDGLPEPLCAAYEPAAFPVLRERLESGCHCPRRVLIDLDDQVQLLELENGRALDNANTPDEASALEVSPRPL